ncbi:MAG: hypothetical protein GY757_19065 [bacterium]|nr:hypothetical protein [bacterium]
MRKSMEIIEQVDERVRVPDAVWTAKQWQKSDERLRVDSREYVEHLDCLCEFTAGINGIPVIARWT